jgi:cell division protein FtsZ
MMGVGTGSGESRALEAAKNAITSPLIEEKIDGAKGMLLNVTGGEDLGLFEVNEAARLIMEACDPNANIVFGAVVDSSMHESVRVTVIATGFEGFELIARAPEFTARRSDRKVSAVQSGRETLSDLRISDSEIDVPDFLK